MDASELISVGPPLPLIASVKPSAGYGVLVEWLSGAREGIAETVDLRGQIRCFKLYRPIRTNRELFETVHVTAGGAAISWGPDDAIDMPATAIQRIAETTTTE